MKPTVIVSMREFRVRDSAWHLYASILFNGLVMALICSGSAGRREPLDPRTNLSKRIRTLSRRTLSDIEGTVQKGLAG
jgi:hypothetical protein